MKKLLAVMMAGIMAVGMMSGCGASEEETASTGGVTGTFDAANPIEVTSREDGSGTRSAFIELVGIEEKDADGNKIDNTTVEANITNSTSVMMTTVSGSEYAIGYISMGSMNNTVKALAVDGVEAAAANVADGSYKIARPFNIVTGSEVSESAQDFINFILSDEGQAIVEENGYIKVESTGTFSSNGASEKVVVAGSSSVSPVMEKLIEAYKTVNTSAQIELQTSDSSTGVSHTIEGICDIGMASRDLKDAEMEEGAVGTVIAMDGIAVIVNNANPLTDITAEQIRQIFVGEVLDWEEIVE